MFFFGTFSANGFRIVVKALAGEPSNAEKIISKIGEIFPVDHFSTFEIEKFPFWPQKQTQK